MSVALDKILQLTKFISIKPNYRSTFFYIDGPTKVCFIDAEKVENLPDTLGWLKQKKHSYFLINLEDHKFVRVYAFDMADVISRRRSNEEDHEIPWGRVEEQILAFLEKNLNILTTYVDINVALETFKNTKQSWTFASNASNNSPPVTPQQKFQGGQVCRGHDTFDWSNENTRSKNDTWNSAYKEREGFLDPLYAMIKNHRNGNAVEYTSVKINELINKDSFEAINQIVRFISLDKMTILAIAELLRSTSKVKNRIDEWNELLGKFKIHLNRINSNKANILLKEIENVPLSN